MCPREATHVREALTGLFPANFLCLSLQNQFKTVTPDHRAELRRKEEELEGAAAALAEADAGMGALAAKYDKTLARIADDRRAVAVEEAERDAELAALLADRQRAEQAQQAALNQSALLRSQVCSKFVGFCDITSVCQNLNSKLNAMCS